MTPRPRSLARVLSPRFAAALGCALLAACGRHSSGVADAGPATFDGGLTGVQLNDVSMLFPLPATQDELDSATLKASDEGSAGVLLPPSFYDAVGHITGSAAKAPTPGGSSEASYADLRATSLRLDPCFAALAPDPHGQGCAPQLRLVFQEVKFNASRGRSEAFDSALHVFYALSRDELLNLSLELYRLRLSRAQPGERLGRLQPHPLMVREGLAGPFAAAVRDLVRGLAGQERIARITQLSSTSTFNWTFKGADFSSPSPSALVAMAIPSLPGSATAQSFFSGFSFDDLEGKFTPATSSADDLTALTNVVTAAGLDAGTRQQSFDALARIDNPSRHSANTIDCASCHLATPAALLVAAPQYSMVESANPNAFAPDGGAVLPGELAPTFETLGQLNLHAFSYLGIYPGISQRTVNETAAIVEYLNQNYP